MNEKTLETAIFRDKASWHAIFNLENLAGRLWWVAALPVAALLAAGVLTGDWRCYILAAMAIFVILPTALFFAWSMALTSKAALRSPYPRKVRLDPAEGMILTFMPAEVTDEPKDDDDVVDDKLPTPPQQGSQPPEPLTVPFADIEWIVPKGRNLDVVFNEAGRRSLCRIPVEAFENAEQAAEFYRAMLQAYDDRQE